MDINNIIAITTIPLFCFALGCQKQDPHEAETRRIEREISIAICDIPKVAEELSAMQFATNLTAKISLLPDVARRREWCRKVMDAVFDIEIEHLKTGCRYRSTGAIEVLEEQISVYWCKEGRTLEEGWCVSLQHLAWSKRQLEWCKAEYAKIGPNTRVRSIPLKNFAVDYEARCERYEQFFWDYGHKMPAESWTNVLRKSEAFFGRPIRTPEQLEEYRQKKAETYRREREVERRQKEIDRENNAKMDINLL
jgi:hypothetical protein